MYPTPQIWAGVSFRIRPRCNLHSPEDPCGETDYEQDQEDEEQNLSDTGRCPGDATKSEKSRYKRDNEK